MSKPDSPPMTVMAIGAFALPHPRRTPIAIGSKPSAVVSVVIRIGRNLSLRPASMIAASALDAFRL